MWLMKAAKAEVSVEGTEYCTIFSQLSRMVTNCCWFSGFSSILMHDVCTNTEVWNMLIHLMGEYIQRCLKHICHPQLSHYWYSTWIQPVCFGNSWFLMPAVQGHWARRHKSFIRQDHHSNGIVLLLLITFEKEKVLPKRVLRRKACHLTVRVSKLKTPSFHM